MARNKKTEDTTIKGFIFFEFITKIGKTTQPVKATSSISRLQKWIMNISGIIFCTDKRINNGYQETLSPRETIHWKNGNVPVFSIKISINLNLVEVDKSWVKPINNRLRINNPLTLWMIKYFNTSTSFRKKEPHTRRGISKTTLSSILIQQVNTDGAPALHHRFLKIRLVNNNFDHWGIRFNVKWA